MFPQKNITPTFYYSQLLKENSRARLHLCLDMVYVFTLPRGQKVVFYPTLNSLIFSVTPPFYLRLPLSSVLTPVINDDLSLTKSCRTCDVSVLWLF